MRDSNLDAVNIHKVFFILETDVNCRYHKTTWTGLDFLYCPLLSPLFSPPFAPLLCSCLLSCPSPLLYPLTCLCLLVFFPLIQLHQIIPLSPPHLSTSVSSSFLFALFDFSRLSSAHFSSISQLFFFVFSASICQSFLMPSVLCLSFPSSLE